MDWNRIREQWRSAGAPVPAAEVLEQVQARDRKLRGQVRRRDLIETIVALAIVPIFAWATWRALQREAWLAAGFAALIVGWVLYVPWHLWRTRRQLPQARHDRPLLDYLRLERDAMRAQARMLERIWIWYLAPCAIGVVGLSLSMRGPTPGVLIYCGVVLAFCVLIGWANHHAARAHFGALARDIDRQINELTEEPRE